jgi:hypothetical protein
LENGGVLGPLQNPLRITSENRVPFGMGQNPAQSAFTEPPKKRSEIEKNLIRQFEEDVLMRVS